MATGTAGAVGLASLTLGGGYGPLCGVAGLAADNLLTASHADQTAHAYGPNAARLTAVKDAYDPDGVFTAIPLPPRP